MNSLSKGVIARSMYYLFYWERDDHVTETDFRQDIVPAIGGVIVEVRFNYNRWHKTKQKNQTLYRDSCYFLYTTKTKGHNIVDVIIRAHTN